MNKVNAELLLQEMEWKEDSFFSFAFQISCPYNSEVLTPKVTLCFFTDTSDRRLPARITSYVPEQDLQTATIFGDAQIRTDCLFTGDDRQKPFSMMFELTYGNETVYPLPFQVTGELQTANPPYTVQFAPEAQKVDFAPSVWQTAKQKSSWPAILLRAVHRVLLTIVSLLLLPWCLLDALFTALHIIPPAANIHMRKSVKAQFIAQIEVFYQTLWHVDQGRDIIKSVINSFFRLFCCLLPVKHNRVSFFSCRRNTLSGNPKFVYNALQDGPKLEFKFLLEDNANFNLRISNILRFLYLYATSSVVLVDEFFQLLNYVDKRPGMRVIQLWHAAGAFKTVGFSRIWKDGGPTQATWNHRQYDFALVSSKEIVPHYSEAFGVPQSHILPLGVPRTDVFLQPEYAEKTRKMLYEKYPALSGKRVILFAPTFRGPGSKTAFYPLERFHPEQLIDAAGEDAVLLLKLHPFCKERYSIPAAYSSRIFDFSDESEINDLLFITDLLITDYSSTVFEASLLSIPMLFYAYDLREYIATRDFYYDFASFVPGKIVQTEAELLHAIQAEDFETEKILPFRRKFFDHADGRASGRAAALVRNLIENNRPQ